MRRTLLRQRRPRDSEEFTTHREVGFEQWTAEHAETIEAERQARARLRAAILDILDVTEEQLAGNVVARKQILSGATVDENGEPFPDIVIAAGSNFASLSVYDRLSTSTPAGWMLKPDRPGYSNSYLNQALGTALETNHYLPIHQLPGISADSAANRVSDVLEFVSSQLQVYDLDGSSTTLVPAIVQV